MVAHLNYTDTVVCNLCMTILFTWPIPTNDFGLIDWLTTEDVFFPHEGMWLAIAACLWSHAPVSLAVSESVWSKKELCSRALHDAIVLYMHFREGSIGLIMWLYVPKTENALQIFTQNWPFKVQIVHILVIITAVTQNHGNCRKSRHKAKITVIIYIMAIVNSWFTYIPSDVVYFS